MKGKKERKRKKALQETTGNDCCWPAAATGLNIPLSCLSCTREHDDEFPMRCSFQPYPITELAGLLGAAAAAPFYLDGNVPMLTKMLSAPTVLGFRAVCSLLSSAQCALIYQLSLIASIAAGPHVVATILSGGERKTLLISLNQSLAGSTGRHDFFVLAAAAHIGARESDTEIISRFSVFRLLFLLLCELCKE